MPGGCFSRVFARNLSDPASDPENLAVTIRVSQACLSKYKALGKGYTGIMADVLDYVADNPEILSKARG